MEKLILLLILNNPDHTLTVQKFETVAQHVCLREMSAIISDPANVAVYEDELGPVYKYAASCVSKDEAKKIILSSK